MDAQNYKAAWRARVDSWKPGYLRQAIVDIARKCIREDLSLTQCECMINSDEDWARLYRRIVRRWAIKAKRPRVDFPYDEGATAFAWLEFCRALRRTESAAIVPNARESIALTWPEIITERRTARARRNADMRMVRDESANRVRKFAKPASGTWNSNAPVSAVAAGYETA